MRHKITVDISPEMKARLKASSEQTPSARIRDGIDRVDELIALGLIDLSPVKRDFGRITIRLDARQQGIVAATASRVGLSPHQLVVRIIQYLAR